MKGRPLGPNVWHPRCSHARAKRALAPVTCATGREDIPGVQSRQILGALVLSLGLGAAGITAYKAVYGGGSGEGHVSPADIPLENRISLVIDGSVREYPGGKDRPLPPTLARTEAELFDPGRYSGRWFEVASLKRGFAGEGQQDCHCTQGFYELTDGLRVATFCVHGSPEGRITGIEGTVSCRDPAELAMDPGAQTPLELKEGLVEKCSLRFPSLPFIPAETYDVLDTDYTTFALVQGSPDRSFVQIYSRTPNPGR